MPVRIEEVTITVTQSSSREPRDESLRLEIQKLEKQIESLKKKLKNKNER